MTDTAAPTETSSAPAPKTPNKGRRVAIVAVGLVIVCALIWFVYWLFTHNQVSTDDAFIQADIAQIAPRVTGTVAQVFVRENQPVKTGDALFTLDPADFQVALAKAEASLEAARAAFAASQKNLSLIRLTTAADIDNAQAGLENAQAEAARSAADAARYKALYARHEVSRQQLDQFTTSATSAAARVRQARAQLAQAQAAPDQIAVRKSNASSAQAKIAQARAEVDQARLNLSYADVRAPADGRVSQKSIVAGSHVSAGQSAMALVENDPWVIANFKETQLTRMRIGQPVSIAIDAYPDHQFTGRVESVQAGTGITFSLLPPQNATGNYVKIVQRVPVKIIFDRPRQLAGLAISPGLSVVPTVNLVGRIRRLNRADNPATATATAPAQ